MCFSPRLPNQHGHDTHLLAVQVSTLSLMAPTCLILVFYCRIILLYSIVLVLPCINKNKAHRVCLHRLTLEPPSRTSLPNLPPSPTPSPPLPRVVTEHWDELHVSRSKLPLAVYLQMVMCMFPTYSLSSAALSFPHCVLQGHRQNRE